MTTYLLPHQILTGTTWHARHQPAKHSFSYPYRYWGLSLKRLAEGDLPPKNQKIHRAVHSFNFADYFDIDKLDDSNTQNAEYKNSRKPQRVSETSETTAKHWLEAVNQEFIRLTGSQPTGDILALVVSRNLGFYFSPVNFYIGFDENGTASHLLAEVSNTPWNKRHFYGFELSGDACEFSHNKDFHVSPFNPLDQVYTWKVKISSTPSNSLRTDKVKHCFTRSQDKSYACVVRGRTELLLKNIKLSIHVSDKRGKVFEAGINMTSQPMTEQNIRQTIKDNPMMNYSSMGRIYWHAFRLYVMKKVPYVGYNEKLKESGQG